MAYPDRVEVTVSDALLPRVADMVVCIGDERQGAGTMNPLNVDGNVVLMHPPGLTLRPDNVTVKMKLDGVEATSDASVRDNDHGGCFTSRVVKVRFDDRSGALTDS